MPTALITGASSGLGREYAKLFATDGHDVVLVARSADKLDALAAQIRETHGVNATVLQDDLGDAGAPARIVEATEGQGRPVEFLVNNAGFGTTGEFAELDVERELGAIQVNCLALTHLTRLVLPRMRERGHGRILNVGSTAAFLPGPYMSVYYASKAFVLSFTEGLSHELKGTGVTATVHCPGATATEFARVAGNDKSLLFRMGAADPAAVARHGYRAMMAGKAVSIPGLRNKLAAQSIRVTPRAVARRVAAALNQAPG